MSIASKLTKSVRQAKEAGADAKNTGETDAVAAEPAQQSADTKKPAEKNTAKPRTGQQPKKEEPLAPIPSRRVWPD